ncbi:MAG: anthranilate synthase component I family protein, partial [Planctomycetota bacterium]|nr:anthranilate synthase component I family protein [Planctomycetota bacterium]
SYLAANPICLLEVRDGVLTIRSGDGSRRETVAGNPFAALKKLLSGMGFARRNQEAAPGAPVLAGGAIGYFGYEMGRFADRIPIAGERDLPFPDMWLGLYGLILAFDHKEGVWFACRTDWEGKSSARDTSSAIGEAENLLRDCPTDLAGQRAIRPPRTPAGRVSSTFDRDGYLAAIARALDYIAAGDIYQVNLSQRFTVSVPGLAPKEAYMLLRKASPGGYSAYIGLGGDMAVLSVSPEMFLTLEGDRVSTRPIKGTRPRGADAEADARLVADLEGSAKEKAELAMIVDLLRNDLGKVCRYGSIRVEDPGSIQTHASVHHRAATVTGLLHDRYCPLDLLRAAFPGGSVTGAPKIRACEIIAEIEPSCRSVYTGSIGFLDSRGGMVFNIAIRTALAEGGRIHYQAGGGIVADSEPAAEYEETLHKAAGFFRALGAEFPRGG